MKLPLACLAAIALCGCVQSAGSRVPGNARAATDPAKIQVLYQEPKRPFLVVGHVSVERAIAGDDYYIGRKFQAVAATMGAQAVIVDRLPKTTFVSHVQGEGRAIVWQ